MILRIDTMADHGHIVYDLRQYVDKPAHEHGKKDEYDCIREKEDLTTEIGKNR
jgi:hypothetical protein